MFGFIENVTKSISEHTNFYKRITSPLGTALYALRTFYLSLN